MRIPGILHSERIIHQDVGTRLPTGEWTPARPLPYFAWWVRWKAAWLVLVGKADALIWKGQ